VAVRQPRDCGPLRRDSAASVPGPNRIGVFVRPAAMLSLCHQSPTTGSPAQAVAPKTP
jgi:hypothetical protein